MEVLGIMALSSPKWDEEEGGKVVGGVALLQPLWIALPGTLWGVEN